MHIGMATLNIALSVSGKPIGSIAFSICLSITNTAHYEVVFLTEKQIGFCEPHPNN